jgi:tight adherence protein B
VALALLTFVVVTALIVGLYWAVVARPEAASQASLKRRLRAVTSRPTAKRKEIFARTARLSDIPALNALLAGTTGLSGRLQNLLQQAGLPWTVGRLMLTSAVCAGVVFAGLNLLTGTILTSMVLALLAGTLPYLYVRHVATKRLRRFEELFPEAISLIIRALRAGHAFTTGLAMVAEEMADPVGPEFRLVYDHQNFGMPVEDALATFARRMPLLDVRFFVTAVLTQREAGGNLAEILENLASVIRDRFKVKRQVRVITAHARITGGLLAGLPPVAAAFLLVVAPGHMKVLWTDPLGIRLVVIAIVLQIVGALLIRKIVDIEY